MRILLDECIDRRLARLLDAHEVTTVQRRGWAGIKNGELLARAAREFDVFVTVDRNLATEQDLRKFDIAIVLLRARSNRLSDLQHLAPELLRQLSGAARAAVTTID